jgi:HD superfamily phosphodiesterase/8-oxo-dGTP pyrophosphatase MutT (NUDIX family)
MRLLHGFSEKEILDLYPNLSSGWNDRLAHVSRVYNLCKQFLRYFPEANEKILLTATLLHDVGHIKEGKHALNGSIMVKELLKNRGFSEKEIGSISECIRTHSFKEKEGPISIEGKILSDCDRIDVINIDTWLEVIDSKINEGIEIDRVLSECESWEKEWFSLGIKFFTKEGETKFKEIKKKKEEIIGLIKENGLKILRRGILIHYFDESFENIFLVKRTKEFDWGVIAGTCEKNEGFVRTAVREFKEEADIERFLFELLPSEISINLNLKLRSLDILHHYCTKKNKSDNPKINFPEEISDFLWCSINNPPKNMIPTNIKLNLRNFIENERSRNQ